MKNNPKIRISEDGKVFAKISDIQITEQPREDFLDIEGLAGDIERQGLLTPVAVTPELVLINGERRMRAYGLLGRDEIEVTVREVTNLFEAVVAANVESRSFTKFESVKITDRLMKGLRKPEGRPNKNLLSSGQQSSETTEALLDQAAKKAGLAGVAEYYRVKKIEKNASPELRTAFINHEVSVRQAVQVCLAQKSIQPSLLTRILKKERAEPTARWERDRERRKRLEKKSAKAAPDYVIPTDDLDKYSVIRVAPDWFHDSLKDICALPVRGFSSFIAVVCLECPTRFLNLAFQVLEAWGLYYRATITLGREKPIGLPLSYMSDDALHIVIGQVDKDDDLPCDEGKRIPTVQIVDDLPAAAMRIETEYFGKHTEGAGYMIDLSTKEPRAGWDTLDKFRKKC